MKPLELTDAQIDAVTLATWPTISPAVMESYLTAYRVYARAIEAASIRAVEATIAAPAMPPLDPVVGDLLPPMGSKVLIHLARQDQWVEHTVVGYYVWGGLLDPYAHRVYVRVMDSDGYPNARMLCDVRPVKTDLLGGRK